MTTKPAETASAEPTEARRFVDSLPVKEPTIDSLKDLIAGKEETEQESPIVRGILTGMTWAMYAVALGTVALIISATAHNYLR